MRHFQTLAAACITFAVVLLAPAWRPACAEPPGIYAGFNVGGSDWRRQEIEGITDPEHRRQVLDRIGHDEARMVHAAGGNMIRTLYSADALLGEEIRDLLRVPGEPWEPGVKPVFRATIEERLQRLDDSYEILGSLLSSIPEGKNHRGEPIRFAALDGYLGGIERFNAGLTDQSQRVRVLLTLICRPPRWIIESPGKGTLGYFRKPYTFDTVWERFVKMQIALNRLVVRRYVTDCSEQRGQTLPPAVRAIEVVNEPDYDWIPDEMRIEWSYHPSSNALGKYITELHLMQIPTGIGFHRAYEVTPWGHQPQDAEWADEVEPVGVFDFPWGPKFDWYVRCFAQLHEHVAFAVRDESLKGSEDGRPRVLLVSGGVTHNNLDYLIRMYRANPNTFKYIDRIGIHPYHWPRHDIFDTAFISDVPHDNWRRVSPQEYARSYFKRFDFLEEFAALIREPDETKSFGMSGKRLWVTEFGIPTKQIGEANRELKDFIKFIRPRHGPPIESAEVRTWEDLWEAFLRQCSRRYLEDNMVDAFLLYALRESGAKGFDLHDDDRSNFAVHHRDGTPRMDAETYKHVCEFLRSLTVPR
ncbi:MAG: hypothetical protein JNK25_02005 [Phycisphaerae bacterium]|nr:hypothetical protein [Phycisphaerae bacterium]